MVCGKCWKTVSGGVVDGDDDHPDYRCTYVADELHWLPSYFSREKVMKCGHEVWS